jgi:ribosome maturation factor RimP
MKDLLGITQQALAGMALEVVDVERAPLGLLRVTIDRVASGQPSQLSGIKIEDCEKVSRQLSRVYEVEGIDYQRLEVGSPGVDRPLRTEQDFERFVGERVEVKLRDPIDNRKVFQGVLARSCSQDGLKRFVIQYQENKGEDKQLTFDVVDIERAKLDPLLDFKGRKR